MPIASSKKTAFAFLPVLTGLFTATLLISNVLNCKFLRFVLSTLVGQFIDSATFVVVAFSGRMPPRQMVLVAFTGWAIMVVWEIAALPLTLPLVRALKRHEGVDYFERRHEF
jgi:hypothetical protein